MHKRPIIRQPSMKYFFILICLFFYTLSLTGCEPLRKKFKRKKKQDKTASSEFIPVLEPIDYPEPRTSPAEQYKYHYSLWKVWYKDFMQNFYENDNQKRAKYLLDQVIIQVQEMKKSVQVEKQAELDGYLKEFVNLRNDLEKPEGLQNRISLKNRLDLVEKKMRNACKPPLMENYLLK